MCLSSLCCALFYLLFTFVFSLCPHSWHKNRSLMVWWTRQLTPPTAFAHPSAWMIVFSLLWWRLMMDGGKLGENKERKSTQKWLFRFACEHDDPLWCRHDSLCPLLQIALLCWCHVNTWKDWTDCEQGTSDVESSRERETQYNSSCLKRLAMYLHEIEKVC